MQPKLPSKTSQLCQLLAMVWNNQFSNHYLMFIIRDSKENSPWIFESPFVSLKLVSEETYLTFLATINTKIKLNTSSSLLANAILRTNVPSLPYMYIYPWWQQYKKTHLSMLTEARTNYLVSKVKSYLICKIALSESHTKAILKTSNIKYA